MQWTYSKPKFAQTSIHKGPSRRKREVSRGILHSGWCPFEGSKGNFQVVGGAGPEQMRNLMGRKDRQKPRKRSQAPIHLPNLRLPNSCWGQMERGRACLSQRREPLAGPGGSPELAALTHTPPCGAPEEGSCRLFTLSLPARQVGRLSPPWDLS